MSILKLKVLLLLTIAISTVFANSDESASSSFHQQNPDTSNIQLQPESSYFAKIAQTSSKLRGYTGLGFGIDMSNLTPMISFNSGAQTIDSSSLKNSVVIDGYGGIGTNFNNFYIGTELSCGYSSLNRKFNSTISDVNAQMTVQKPITIGLDLIPGFLSPEQSFLFYGRMGIGSSWFNVKIENETNSKWNKLDLAWRLGAGMEYFMGEFMSWRIDYVFSNNSKITKNFNSSITGSNFYRLPSLYDHKITVGLTFNF